MALVNNLQKINYFVKGNVLLGRPNNILGIFQSFVLSSSYYRSQHISIDCRESYHILVSSNSSSDVLRKFHTSCTHSYYLTTTNRLNEDSDYRLNDDSINSERKTDVSDDSDSHSAASAEKIEVSEEHNICDISRMPTQYRNRMLHVMHPPDINKYLDRLDFATDIKKSTTLRREVYAKFGKKSGINPGYIWPSKEELKEIQEIEREFEPRLEERLRIMHEEKSAEEDKIKTKDRHIAKQVERMPKLIDEYRARLEKTRQLELKQEEKRKALMEEAREYFGYNIDLKDPRFLELQQRKEEEEKKLKKKKKKEEKAARWLSLIK